MKKIVKDTLILTIITVVAGFCLGYVYDITKEPIAKTQETAKQNAYRAVFNEADSFVEGEISHVANSDIALEGAGLNAVHIDEALEAQDASGNTLGYVFTITDSEGYGGDITITMGITNEGVVNGVEILNISETAGLGMKATTEEFRCQFANKQVSKFAYSKVGAKEAYEIDALSGATITTNAMVNAVNGGLAYFTSSVGGGIHE